MKGVKFQPRIADSVSSEWPLGSIMNKNYRRTAYSG